MRRIHHRTSTSPDRVPWRRRIAAAGTGTVLAAGMVAALAPPPPARRPANHQRSTPVMRTLIARAVAIPAAAAATTVPVLSWAPATAGGYSFGTLRARSLARKRQQLMQARPVAGESWRPCGN